MQQKKMMSICLIIMENIPLWKHFTYFCLTIITENG
jgi:hypothetical protein